MVINEHIVSHAGQYIVLCPPALLVHTKIIIYIIIYIIIIIIYIYGRVSAKMSDFYNTIIL